MQSKQRLKILISSAAIVVALAHIIFPDIKIDLITLALICLAFIPWVEPLFKSVSVPGGLSFEFHDLEKLESKAKKAGLIPQSKKNTEHESSVMPKQYDFIDMAESRQELAITMLRVEIEKKLWTIAAKNHIGYTEKSILELTDVLISKNILRTSEADVLKELIVVLNNIKHNGSYDDRITGWIKEIGPLIIENLEKKIQHTT